jgi:hypothetical protein
MTSSILTLLEDLSPELVKVANAAISVALANSSNQVRAEVTAEYLLYIEVTAEYVAPLKSSAYALPQTDPSVCSTVRCLRLTHLRRLTVCSLSPQCHDTDSHGAAVPAGGGGLTDGELAGVITASAVLVVLAVALFVRRQRMWKVRQRHY